MSIETRPRFLHPRTDRAIRLQHLDPAPWAGLGLAALLLLPKTAQVATTGIFLNPDDAMRAVEVRDYLGGQGWYDLVPHRLSPDHPFTMHWSRLWDLPLALVARLFGLVLKPDHAELAMRLLVPSLLLVGALWIVLDLVRDLVGPRARLPAALLLAGSVEVVGSFIPGHIHHHGIQLVLLLGTAKAVTDAVRTGRRGFAALAGLLTALSLGIGLQSLPFFVVLVAALPVWWIASGNDARGALASFGGSLALAALLVFLLDVPPWAFATLVCDSFSAAHLLALGLGGLLLVALAALSPRLPSRALRLAAAVTCGGLVLGAVAVAAPACLHDPMSGVDPLLRREWLSEVGEALPLVRLIALSPAEGVALAVTLVLGLAATVLATRHAEVQRRPQWWLLLALGLVGLVGTAYQVRVAASTCAFLVPGAAWAVLAFHDRLARNPRCPALLLTVLAGLALNGAGLSAAATIVARHWPTSAPSGSAATAPLDPASCFEPSLYAGLARLPRGVVLSTIDPGSAILAATPHGVLAAPYHRNTAGIRVALLALNAPAAAAEPIVRDSHATYLVLCRASNETAESVRLHPQSLSADLLAGRTPPWLAPVDLPGPLLLYRVVQ